MVFLKSVTKMLKSFMKCTLSCCTGICKAFLPAIGLPFMGYSPNPPGPGSTNVCVKSTGLSA